MPCVFLQHAGRISAGPPAFTRNLTRLIYAVTWRNVPSYPINAQKDGSKAKRLPFHFHTSFSLRTCSLLKAPEKHQLFHCLYQFLLLYLFTEKMSNDFSRIFHSLYKKSRIAKLQHGFIYLFIFQQISDFFKKLSFCRLFNLRFCNFFNRKKCTD